MAAEPLINNTIKKLSKEGFSAPEISEMTGFEESAVVAIISSMDESAINKISGGIKEKFMEHVDDAVLALATLAQSAENEGVKCKAATVICEFANGTKDPKKIVQNISVENINAVLIKGRETYEETMRKFRENKRSDIIDIKSVAQ